MNERWRLVTGRVRESLMVLLTASVMMLAGVAFGDDTVAAGTNSSAVVASAPAAAPKVDTGDTAWVLISSALVLMMTIPALALFYGGLVRRKNVLSVLMQCFIITCTSAFNGWCWVILSHSGRT